MQQGKLDDYTLLPMNFQPESCLHFTKNATISPKHIFQPLERRGSIPNLGYTPLTYSRLIPSANFKEWEVGDQILIKKATLRLANETSSQVK